MADYYEILGISKSASSTEIRIAYKRLAMEYHPDRNPGDPSAEERFKQINEAYHLLSDPLKKARYDVGIEPVVYVENVVERERRRRHSQWVFAHQKRYKIDREYFKIQGLAFLVFIVIAGFCFAMIHTASYFIRQKRLEVTLANAKSLQQANTLFLSGRFDDAFDLLHTLKEKDPSEYRFRYAHDSLVTELQRMAEKDFNEHNFVDAITHYRVLQQYEDPVSRETIQKIAMCQYYLGNYKEALQSMKHLHNQDPSNLVLIYNIGVINFEQLENPVEALQYFDLGEKLFKENLSAVYGKAFMIVMDPADAPDIYCDIFVAKAKTNLALKKYEDVKLDCDWAIFLRPSRGAPYTIRAMGLVKTKRRAEACQDLALAQKYGDKEANQLLEKYCR